MTAPAPIATVERLVAEEGTCPLCKRKKQVILRFTLRGGLFKQRDICTTCFPTLLSWTEDQTAESKSTAKVAESSK